MTALGFVLLLLGATLVVVEAHVPGGVAGVAGGVALVAGGIIAIVGFGGSVALAVPAWVLVAAGKTAAARRGRIQSGAGALPGRVGVVRGWTESSGQVFVDGALWRAKCDWMEPEETALAKGDPVVVEQVRGLTLSVRPAEDWELVG
jgi:membrane protein implicated in regulation of membrane protease activity